MLDPINLTEDDLIDACDITPIPAAYTPPEGTGLLITEPRVSPDITPQTYFCTLPALKALLIPPVVVGNAPAVALAPITSSTVGTSLNLSATATSAASTIVKVEFFVGGQLVGTATSAPYAASYTPTAPGTIYVSAKGTDANGQSTTATQPVVVNVSGTATNLPPLVSLSATPSPTTAGQPVTLNATASDPDGTVQTVQFYNSGILLNTVTTPPYVASFIPASAGTLLLSAKATDNGGISTVASVQLVVSPAPVTTVTPDPPTQTSDDAANTQDFDSPYGKAALLVKVGSGSFGSYAGPYAVGNVDRPEGYYQAKVRADTGRAESAVTSSPAFFAAAAPTPAAPSAPQELFAALLNNVPNITWGPPASGGTSALTGYDVYRSGTTAKIATTAPGVRTYDDSAATPGTYTYSVRAVNSVGAGPAGTSNQVTVASLAPPSFDTTLSAGLPLASPGQGDGVVFAAASSQHLRYNTLPNTSGNSVSMQITDSSDNSVSYVTLNDEYGKLNNGQGAPYGFDRANGTTYYGTLPANDTNLTA